MMRTSFRGLLATAGTIFFVGLGAAACTSASNESAPGEQKQSERSLMGDAGITAAIKARLLADRALESFDISVTTNDGVATLEGVVPDAGARETAARVARKVDGVAGVTNRLTTAANPTVAESTMEVVSDSWITAKVKSELLADSLSKGFDVGVETLDGMVLLDGELRTQKEIDHVKAVAARVEGVKSVDTTALTVVGKKG